MNEIEPFDDPKISNDDDLYRRIPPYQIKEDENRPTSAAFRDLHLPVNLARLTTPAQSMDPEKNRPDFYSWRLACFKTLIPRTLSLQVYMVPEPDNPAHTIVFGEKSLIIRRKLAHSCSWAEFPNG